jgi:hypothetical protein
MAPRPGRDRSAIYVLTARATDPGSRLRAYAFNGVGSGVPRVLANEFPKLDVRRIDISQDLPLDLAAQRIRNIVFSGTNETELHVDKRTVRAVRVSGLRQVVESKSARDSAASPNPALPFP